MKPLTLGEIQQIVIDLQTLVGAQLQEVFQSGANLALGFYHDRTLSWLWFDLDPMLPVVVRLSDIPKQYRKETKPLSLFLKAHFSGARLKAVSTSPELGRVFELHFQSGVLQARLFPRGQNFIATVDTIIRNKSAQKVVSYDKVKELQASQTDLSQNENHRSWEQIEQEWRVRRKIGPAKTDSAAQPSGPDEQTQAEKQFKRDLEKKEKALEKMREDLKSKQSSVYREAGEFLKSLMPTDFPESVPLAFQSVIDKEKSLAENIELLFKKAKDNERKLNGTRERIQLLESEIADLRVRGPIAKAHAKTQSGTKKKSLLEAASARGRKLQIADDLEVYIGKSAADNLSLLRKAQPFDYWLHLRDYPGSHAIVRRTRNRIVKDQEFQQIGEWVVQQSLHKSAEQLSDSRYDVLIVECRFVRPIKGDKLGRVNYTNDRVFVVRF